MARLQPTKILNDISGIFYIQLERKQIRDNKMNRFAKTKRR